MEMNTQDGVQSQELAGGNAENTDVLKADENGKVSHEAYYDVVTEAKKAKARARKAEEKAARADELEVKVSEYEKKELEREGKSHELLERYREEAKTQRERVQELERQRAYDAVFSVVKDKLVERGCVDISDAILVGNHAGIFDFPEDADGKYNPDDIDMAADSLTKMKPHLFKRNVADVKDMPPANRPFQQPTKSTNEMSTDELKEKIRQMAAQE
jgi:hypothetical protein